ncbi:cell wall anchor protein [Solwaraspora sp. WMMB335]|uniref:cell wall anchor protein n=1 Tax=Solwaraspora sp. WMMB335 TaxID=3404118 RepID=UPI003B9480D7
MNRLKSPLRRALAVAAGATIGLTGAVALATPASAHYTDPVGSAVCDTTTGEWVVTWSVSSNWHFDSTHFRLKAVLHTPLRSPVAGIERTPIRDGYPYPVDEPIVGEQRVPGNAERASLAVMGSWNDGYAEDEFRTSKIRFLGECAIETPDPTPSPTVDPSPDPTPEPSPTVDPTPEPTQSPEPEPIVSPAASFLSDCDGFVWVTLSNGEDATEPVEMTVVADDFSETHTIEPGASKDDVVVPGDAGPITVYVGEEPIGEPYTWEEPENCVEPGEPEGGYESTCDELVIGFANPEDGEAFTVMLTPNSGEAQTVTVEPGATEIISFPGEEGLEVHVLSEELEIDETIVWEMPEDCEGGEGGGGGLPVTGAAAGGIAAGALVLLAVGIGLFLMARRRRITFTA